jgi:type II restriction/modification system DNA methylase subunit YeeA
LDIWLEARDLAIHKGFHLATQFATNHMVSPSQLFGIEVEYYAHELASVVVWIGYLQWKIEHGIFMDRQPILERLTNIEYGDAILRYDSEGKSYEPHWPQADFIVGNPPFLGGNRLREELPDEYVDALQHLYSGRVSAAADLVTYWFEKSRALLTHYDKLRVGLLATQSIRGGVNRRVLERIKETGDLFMAWSDRPWLLEGAVVRVSMIGFDDGRENHRVLNGSPVSRINADLTSTADTTSAVPLKENVKLCFRTDEKGGPFEIRPEAAQKMLSAPTNVNRRPNSDVVRRWINATDITARDRGLWIIDFHDLHERQAEQYEWPFETLKKQIADERRGAAEGDRVAKARSRWWLHRRPGSEMRRAVANLDRYIATIATGKHRLFVWLDHSVLPDHQLYAIARQDDYFFGVLHSTPHELWARAKGTQTRDAESGCRYTPTSTFETFPFPWPPNKEPSEADNPRVKAIADAARKLVSLRDTWLNPPGIDAAQLKTRTLTNLYNNRPA